MNYYVINILWSECSFKHINICIPDVCSIKLSFAVLVPTNCNSPPSIWTESKIKKTMLFLSLLFYCVCVLYVMGNRKNRLVCRNPWASCGGPRQKCGTITDWNSVLIIFQAVNPLMWQYVRSLSPHNVHFQLYVARHSITQHHKTSHGFQPIIIII